MTHASCGPRLVAAILTALLISAAARAQSSAPSELDPAVPARPLAKPAAKSAAALAADAFQKTTSAKTVEDYSLIIDLCQQALDQAPDANTKAYAGQLLAWAANRRGESYSAAAAKATDAGKNDDAIALDAKALEDFTLAVTSDPTKWKSLHNRGVSYALVGKYEEALDDLTKAIELKGDYVNTWFNRAEVRYELGQYDDAVADYSEVIQRSPEDFGAFTGRGHAYFRMGEIAKALADYQKAVTLDQASAGALVNRGDAFRQQGQFEKAAADYRAAVKLDENYGRAYRAAAWLMATCPDDRLRSPDLALAAAEKALDLDGPEDFLYHDTLAAAYASAGKFPLAVQSAERALQSAPAEARLPLQERLSLYKAKKAYRLPLHAALRPTPAKR